MTNDAAIDNKRVAKNTLILYMRMFLTVGISFYTTRVVLANLGISDYGLYNVIGSIISMLYIVSSTLAGSISRFLTVEIGKGDISRLKEVFVTSVNILLFASLIVIVLGEVLGVWFVNNKLNTAPDRLIAANWIFQFTLASFVLEMLCLPVVSLVIAHERMKVYAYVQILSVLMNLGIATLLAYSPIDRLVFYGSLMLVAAIIKDVIYIVYCRKNFEECIYKRFLDVPLFKQMFSFTGWMTMSMSCIMLSSSGIGLVLNIFWGTIVNAANGVAVQIRNAVGSFSRNFIVALSPQITKSVAQGDNNTAVQLVYRGSKFSYLLVFMIVSPVFIEVEYILEIWLKEIPAFAVEFTRLTLLYLVIDVLFQPISILNTAIGKIKYFQIIYSFFKVLPLPLSIIVSYLNFPPYCVLITNILSNLCLFVPCFYVNKRYIQINGTAFLKDVILPIGLVSSVTLMIPCVIILTVEQSFMRLVINLMLTLSVFAITSYFIGLTHQERIFVNGIVKSKFLRR